MVFSIGRKSIKTPCTIVHFGQIFPFFETDRNVSRGSEEYSFKVSVKDLLYLITSGF